MDTTDTTPVTELHAAVLGMDVVSFSTLPEGAQLAAIQNLLEWVEGAITFYRMGSQDYRWSPAGDGGYLTLKTPSSSERALDVALKILERSLDLTWTGAPQIQLRFGLHAGTVVEAKELGRGTNIWGDGINTAARVLSICTPSQVLASENYYNSYIKGKQRETAFNFGNPYCRTVKHGKQVWVRNVWRENLGVVDNTANAHR